MRERLTSAQFASQIERLMARARDGLADADDIEAVCRRADARSPHGWFITWMERAGQTRAAAREALKQGDAAGAAAGYLRASEYFRAAAAVYWPERGDAAVADALRLHVECFWAALDLNGPPYRPFTVTSDEDTISGYLLQPPGTRAARGVLLCCGPISGTTEEQYGLAGMAALRRGWWVALADPDRLAAAALEIHRANRALAALRAWLETVMDEPPASLALVGAGNGGAELAGKLARCQRDIPGGWRLADSRQGAAGHLFNSETGDITCDIPDNDPR